MKFPYGMSDFHKLITKGYFYVDRTNRIPVLEEAGDQLLFLRPRRFGKSLLLSMLENYYDLAKADEFKQLFGHLAIGNTPTELHNQYFVLKWDFSVVRSQSDPRDIQQALYDHLNERIHRFATSYQQILTEKIAINPTNAIASFESLLTAVLQTPYRLYLLIDEYDNFANEVLMSSRDISPARYDALLSGEGALKALFKAVKAASTGEGVDRVFITGVSPVVLSDLTSGYNIAENITFDHRFQNLCGFTEPEVVEALTIITSACDFPESKIDEALTMMRTYYNGYCFGTKIEQIVYNSTLALYFMKHFQRECTYPEEMLDANLAIDQEKLAYVSRLPGGDQVIWEAMNEQTPLSVKRLADRFGVKEMVRTTQDNVFMTSLLYYLGVLTLGGRNSEGKLVLKIPNLVVRKLYVEQIQILLLPEGKRNTALQVAEAFYRNGDMQSVCEFMEQHLFTVFDNRDYRWVNELTFKTAFLTVVFDDFYYMIDSETALDRDYADLTIILRPDMRQYQLLDFLVEFKYVGLKDLKLSGDETRGMDEAALQALPLVRQQFATSRTKLEGYRKTLNATYGNRLSLHCYTVVALGFDRLLWKEIS